MTICTMLLQRFLHDRASRITKGGVPCVTHLAEQQDGLLQFVLQHAGLHQLQRPAVDAEISTATLAVGDRGRAFLQQEDYAIRHAAR